MVFLSIFLATCRPNNIVRFLQNLADTAENPNNFEVLIKIDEGDADTLAAVESYKPKVSYQIKYLVTAKLDGYYSLHFGYNDLLKIADKTSYFCWLLTDEIKMQTPGWDGLLKKYIGLYPDDIFRLKLSVFQLKNYYDLKECLSCPDNYAVTTKKWLDIAGGWGDFWGPDSWHQCVDYFLGLCKQAQLPFAYYRSIPVFGIHIDGQEAGQTNNAPILNRRMTMIPWGWNYHSTHAAQENYFRLALRLKAHIVAHMHHLKQYMLIENPIDKTVSLLSNTQAVLFEDSFALPRYRFVLYLGVKKWHITTALFKYHRLIRYCFYARSRSKRLQFEFYQYLGFIKRSIKKALLYPIRPGMFMLQMVGIYKPARSVYRWFKQALTVSARPAKPQVIYFYDGEKLQRLETLQTHETAAIQPHNS